MPKKWLLPLGQETQAAVTFCDASTGDSSFLSIDICSEFDVPQKIQRALQSPMETEILRFEPEGEEWDHEEHSLFSARKTARETRCKKSMDF